MKRRIIPFMTMKEVVLHNTENDCWVIINGRILDLTPLIEKYKGIEEHNLIKPIIAHAGKDISHWFNKNNNIIEFIHPITGVKVPYTPHGRIPDVGLQVPSTEWEALQTLPWWQDSKYVVGILTKNSRPIRIMNTLNGESALLHVCCEDNIKRILERYLPFNKHATSYTWKFEHKILDMDLTLDENGIKDERKLFLEIGLPDNFYIPCLMLYFNDDLTEA
ncbi:cytochrome b5 domain-containing protein 1 [Lycorma delicatula]|uniref:cytochrome b5 domain-containing protein 1 n=1 Tax=Lycorma delicatula TaxID=130591 RepID=UPI003F51127D